MRFILILMNEGIFQISAATRQNFVICKRPDPVPCENN